MLKEYQKIATIKAEQFDGSEEMMKKYHLIDGRDAFRFNSHIDPGKVYIVTLEGNFEINTSDWIATGVNGEHWAIDSEIFNKTYAELPVIPKVWGDTIEEFKANHYRLSEMFNEWNWNCDEQELIIRAWLDGYTVDATD